MAAGTLGLSPHLLPWQQAGVDFLLAQDDLPPEFSLCHEAQPARVVPPTRQPSGHTPPARSAQPAARGFQQQAPGSGPAPTGIPSGGRMADRMAQRARHNADPAAPPQSAANPDPRRETPAQAHNAYRYGAQPSAATRPMPPASPPAPILPPEHWPRPWRERLKATKPGPVVWTYWALGEDLCGTPDAERRALLRRLLGDLGHPAGTHTFWPAALPPASATGPVEASMLEAHAQVFWAGVDMLKARALVVMGSPAVKALELPPRLRPFQQTRHNGRLVVVLRDVDFLVAESHHYDATREFLRQALAPFSR